MIRRIAPVLLSVGLLASPALAFDPASMSDAERDAFRSAVRSYLLDNPEVLLEAMDVLEKRQANAQASEDQQLAVTNAEALFNDPTDWVGGNPDGDIRMVEFLDYRCGYCKRAHPEIAKLLETDGNIRLTVKEFPILGEQSVLASRFAIATRMVEGDDAYKAVKDTLMSMRAAISQDSLNKVASDLGYDADAIAAKMNSAEVTQVIGDTMLLAQRLKVQGTPTFVIEDQMLRGFVPADKMAEIIAAVRAEG